MPELPGPPEKYTEEQRQAWLQGAATVARLLGQQNAIIAGKYEDQAGEDREPTANEDPDSCPECGGELLESFGGAVCTECDYESD